MFSAARAIAISNTLLARLIIYIRHNIMITAIIQLNEIQTQVVEWIIKEYEELSEVKIIGNSALLFEDKKQAQIMVSRIEWGYQIIVLGWFGSGRISKFKYESLLADTNKICKAIEKAL
ncbi:hypothetical protein QJS24_gp26 [Serratia phage vB_SmaS_Rovert]|uniref:Uncharacterized protein n=1 Tax=Serratia phage vB_SmaS_Rovert TaxID=2777363 RepID=A0A7T3TL12_9CAUD|nr:hypothetical protein QJS24_gp26 [Serratia phage vB_SmaS_Rovert]QPX74994.1 hypothetical protein [Serratia phage vB_SmaS_Rovert]